MAKSQTPRHFAVIDIDMAMRDSADVLDVFYAVCAWPDSPPFSGGVYDAWPQKYAQGLSVCRAEMNAIRELEKEKRHG